MGGWIGEWVAIGWMQMDVYIDGWMDGWVGWVDEWINECVSGGQM